MQTIGRVVSGLILGAAVAVGAQAQSRPPADSVALETDVQGLPQLLPGHQYEVLHRTFPGGHQACVVTPNDSDGITQWFKAGVGPHPSWTDPALPLWGPGHVRVYQAGPAQWVLPDYSPVPELSPFVQLCNQGLGAPVSSDTTVRYIVTMQPGGAFTATSPEPLCASPDGDGLMVCGSPAGQMGWG
jgi:hypothetical protein